MKKLQKKAPVYKGELAAFLALVFMLVLSLTSALVQSAYARIENSRKRADTMLALESVLAEYDITLLEQYEIFARMGMGEKSLQEKLYYYGADEMEHQIKAVERLTDNGGAPFYSQAVQYAKQYFAAEELQMGFAYEFSEKEDPEQQEQSVLEELEELLQQEDASLPKENNPISSMQAIKNSGLLAVLLPEETSVSKQSINRENVASLRELATGNREFKRVFYASDKVFFLAYIGQVFSNFENHEEEKALLYEQEYLLSGGSTDKENLETVCKKILSIRTAANYAYLLTDQGKQAEAEAAAVTLCSLISLPAITTLVKHAILLAWAYGEGIVDMRVLLRNEKVPLVKTAENWQLQLANLAALGTGNEQTKEKPSSEGLNYNDYVQGLLLLESKETLCMRSLDLIEINTNIKADGYITWMELESERTFSTTFGYQ